MILRNFSLAQLAFDTILIDDTNADAEGLLSLIIVSEISLLTQKIPLKMGHSLNIFTGMI